MHGAFVRQVAAGRSGGAAFVQRRLALALAHEVDEAAAEEVVAVLRAGRSFRVMLHREDRLADDADAAIGAVEEGT